MEGDKDINIDLDSVIGESKTFYLAGHGTTLMLLAWTVLLLAKHTEWQERAREEVLDLFGQEKPTADGIVKLKTVTMIINETLRLYSPAPDLPKSTNRKVRLGSMTIPAHTDLLIPVMALHQDSEIWGADVHLFKPERLAEGIAKATNNNAMAFIPFGWGSRTCVGMNFAIMEAKVTLPMILQRFKLTVSPKYVHCPVNQLLCRPGRGVQIILKKTVVNAGWQFRK